MIPVSRGRHSKEFGPSEADVDEIAVEDYSLPSFSEMKRQKSAETEAFLTSTELNKRRGGCGRFPIKKVCSSLSESRVFKTLCPEQRERVCKLIDDKRCACSPGKCEYCLYASRK